MTQRNDNLSPRAIKDLIRARFHPGSSVPAELQHYCLANQGVEPASEPPDGLPHLCRAQALAWQQQCGCALQTRTLSRRGESTTMPRVSTPTCYGAASCCSCGSSTSASSSHRMAARQCLSPSAQRYFSSQCVAVLCAEGLAKLLCLTPWSKQRFACRYCRCYSASTHTSGTASRSCACSGQARRASPTNASRLLRVHCRHPPGSLGEPAAECWTCLS